MENHYLISSTKGSKHQRKIMAGLVKQYPTCSFMALDLSFDGKQIAINAYGKFSRSEVQIMRQFVASLNACINA